MYFSYFFVCFVFKLFLLCVHLTLCAITLEVINHKNMVNCVIVLDVKIVYIIMSSNHARFMNFGKKLFKNGHDTGGSLNDRTLVHKVQYNYIRKS